VKFRYICIRARPRHRRQSPTKANQKIFSGSGRKTVMTALF
jgi:hypothetical protein